MTVFFVCACNYSISYYGITNFRPVFLIIQLHIEFFFMFLYPEKSRNSRAKNWQLLEQNFVPIFEPNQPGKWKLEWCFPNDRKSVTPLLDGAWFWLADITDEKIWRGNLFKFLPKIIIPTCLSKTVLFRKKRQTGLSRIFWLFSCSFNLFLILFVFIYPVDSQPNLHSCTDLSICSHH